MGTRIQTLYNANAYVDGDNFAGIVEELTTPDFKPKMTDHKPLSGIGGIKIPTGLDEMTFKMKLNSIEPVLLAKSADFYTAQDIMIRANSDIWENDSRSESVPVTFFIRGRSTGVPAIGLKHQDNPDIELNYTVHYYKVEIDGVVLFEVDYYAQVYIVNGSDLMAAYRANLGI